MARCTVTDVPKFVFTEDLMIMGELYEMSTEWGTSSIWFILNYLEHDGFAFVTYYDYVTDSKNKGIFWIKDLSNRIIRRIPLLSLHNVSLMSRLIDIQSRSTELRKTYSTPSSSTEWYKLEKDVVSLIPRVKRAIPKFLNSYFISYSKPYPNLCPKNFEALKKAAESYVSSKS